MERARIVRQLLMLAGLAAAVAAFALATSARHGFFDLRVYHGAVNYWVHDGGDIYDYLRADTRYGFTYPPFAALAMLPMAYVSWPAAIVLSVAAAVVTTAVVLWWLVDPIARREGWTRWFALGVACCLAAALEPVRETVNFGQVNTLLLFLVAVDLLWLKSSRFAGVGVGLATAVKLTPGIFVLYFLVTRRWRAAATATGTAAAVTLLAGLLAPDASREFWTEAVWNTDRVGSLAYVSNQSLEGVVARLDPDHPSTLAWLALVAAALAVWAWRVRRADEVTGLALTGVVSCLVSPVTWVHHLVWLLPALVVLVDAALAAPPSSRRRRAWSLLAISAYAVLCSRVVWLWRHDPAGVGGFLGANAYVWVSLALLLALPASDTGLRRQAPVRLAGISHPSNRMIDSEYFV